MRREGGAMDETEERTPEPAEEDAISFAEERKREDKRKAEQAEE